MKWLPLLACLISGPSAGSDPPRPATVVELFTAQGCPACPAADTALIALARRPGLIALTLPVTYWDARGWPDPLAQAAFTDRQRRYAAIGRREAATPQFVIDGRYATSASDPVSLDRAIDAAARRGGPAIDRRGDVVTIGADPLTARPATVWIMDYDPRPIRTAIRGGHTRGRTAIQVNVVRRLGALGRWTGVSARYRVSAKRATLRRVAIVQSADGGAIVAAAVIG